MSSLADGSAVMRRGVVLIPTAGASGMRIFARIGHDFRQVIAKNGVEATFTTPGRVVFDGLLVATGQIRSRVLRTH